MKVMLGVLCSVLLGLPAAGQKLDGLEFFKGSAGTWSGKGASEVGPQKAALQVVDVWTGRFSADGLAFAQSGRITLSNGATFGYRWVYRYEEGRLLARYQDTNNQQSIHEVSLGEDGKSISVRPLAADKTPLKAGLFSVVNLEEGKYVYKAEVRGADGKATVRTKVVCGPQAAPSKKAPDEKEESPER